MVKSRGSFNLPPLFLGRLRPIVQVVNQYLVHYCNDPKFSDRYAWANSADPDQTDPRGAV